MDSAVIAALTAAVPLAICLIGKLYFEARDKARQDREKNEKIALLFIEQRKPRQKINSIPAFRRFAIDTIRSFGV